MTAKKMTLSIGIPAYNEEANVKKLLSLLLTQKQDNFNLVEIIVNSDGSSDRTVQRATEIENPLIKVWNNTERIGKTKRINEILLRAEGDILAIIDADVIPTSERTFDELVTPFLENEKVVYVSGSLIPLQPKNFVQKAASVSRSVWDKVRKELKNGNSVYACHGAIYALKKSFARQATFPDSIWADIGFHYFLTLQRGCEFVSAPKASVYFALPKTASDYIRQISRYQREDLSNIQYFGDQIKKEYIIPKSMLFRYKLEALLTYPFHVLAIFGLNFYAKHFNNAKANAVADWTMINSTKEELSYD